MKKYIAFAVCVIALSGCFKKKEPLIEKIDVSEALSVRKTFFDCRDATSVKELRKCVGGDFKHKYGECLFKEYTEYVERGTGLTGKIFDTGDRLCCAKLYVNDIDGFMRGVAATMGSLVGSIFGGFAGSSISNQKCMKQQNYFKD